MKHTEEKISKLTNIASVFIYLLILYFSRAFLRRYIVPMILGENCAQRYFYICSNSEKYHFQRSSLGRGKVFSRKWIARSPIYFIIHSNVLMRFPESIRTDFEDKFISPPDDVYVE